MRSCSEIPSGSVVFLRAGMDVPLKDGKITDASRIEETRPTIDLLRKKNCKIVLSTHIGRPAGTDPALSTKPIWSYLNQFYPTQYVPEVFGVRSHDAIAALGPGEILLLENLRYDEREEKNDPTFAEFLVHDVDSVVIDAYSNAHREHASMVGVLKYKPGYAGLLLQKELSMLQRLEHPEHPYVAIIGGAKADKLDTIQGLLDHVDVVLVGGVLANTFLKAAGFSVGNSKTDDAKLDHAARLYRTGKIIVPVDAVVADKFAADAQSSVLPLGQISSGLILDIGPQTIARYTLFLSKAKTIVWGGPIGGFEWPQFSSGTKAIAKAVAESGAYTLAAGGDSGAALVALGYKDKISHVSTGGGVTLQLLEGKPLAAVVALEQNSKKTFS